MQFRRAHVLVAIAFVGGPTTASASDKKACAAAYEAGQAERDAGRLLAARAHLTLCASEECPRVLRADCAGWLRGVNAAVPAIVVRAVDEDGRDVNGATLEVDGAPTPIDGRQIELDPGSHVLRLRVGAVSTEEHVVLAQSEKERVVVARLVLRRADPSPPAASAVAVPVAATVTTPAPPPGRSPWPYVIGGAGIATLGVATYFYVDGFSEGGALADRCGSPPRCPTGETDAAHTQLIVGDILAAVGLVAIGVSIHLLVSAPPARRPAEQGAFRMRF